MEAQLLRVEEAARVLSLGRSKTYQLVLDGQIPSVSIGKSRRVPAAALQRWIERKAAEAEESAAAVGA